MVRFQWDDRKNQANLQKHGVDFDAAKLVFEDPHHLSFVERVTDGEPRWHAIGSIAGIVTIVVVHTYEEQGSDELIRIISARKASRRERELYGKALQRQT